MSAQSFARHEAESRKWIATCPQCGLRRSIWELGGLRGGASGKPATRLHCPSCHQTGWHKVRYEP
jgi:ribosomal protein S27AE